MEQMFNFVDKYLANLYFPAIRWTDVVEVLVIAVLVYYILVWVKNTRAWSLLKGVVVILLFFVFAAIFNMTTILWIAENVFTIAVTAIVVILQPELRRALETLGRKNILASILPFETGKNQEGKVSSKTISEIRNACTEMSRAKTGALIVIENEQILDDYCRTGIEVDGVVTSQLLINIFEHNTPLHDGAVIVRGNRVLSATCYLPLSDSMNLGKELGTRHRAGVGISEVTDSVTVIVSEETGKISVAIQGKLERNVSPERLMELIDSINTKNNVMEGKKNIKKWKGRVGNGKKANQ